MMEKLPIYAGVYPIAGAAILAVLATVCGWRIPSRWLWIITGLGVAASLIRLINYIVLFFARPEAGVFHDVRIFYRAGLVILAGADPYEMPGWVTYPILHPPTAFPYFALMASLPFEVTCVLWAIVDSFLAVGLVLVARRIFTQIGEASVAALPPAEVGLLVTVIALCGASQSAIGIGQFGIRAAAVILFAVLALTYKRSILSGALFGLATIKIATMLPFMLFVLRRRDWTVWIALGATVCVLVLLGGQPTRLIEQCGEMLQRIGDLSKPGAINDISFTGTQNFSILGIDFLAYRLGVRGWVDVKIIQAVVLAGLGLALAYGVIRGPLKSGLGLALISLYSVIFLYHRAYDLVILAPAVLYSFSQAKACIGWRRAAFGAATAMMVSAMYFNRDLMEIANIIVKSHDGVLSKIAEYTLLPYTTWMILGSMILIFWAGRGKTDGSKDLSCERGGSSAHGNNRSFALSSSPVD
jgi:hypothetical protein